jgi:phosphate transport system protein
MSRLARTEAVPSPTPGAHPFMVLSAPTQSRYRQELVDLRHMLLEMGGLAEDLLGCATEALIQQDAEHLQRAEGLEQHINELERQIDDRCVKILALHQPAASELRFVTMAMKIIRDIERIGDLASNVAKRSAQLLAGEPFQIPADLPRLSRAVRVMTTSALDAFVDRSVEAAQAVLASDDEADELYWRLYHRFERWMQDDPTMVTRGLTMVLVIKDLERAADHATNVARGVIFLVHGR